MGRVAVVGLAIVAVFVAFVLVRDTASPSAAEPDVPPGAPSSGGVESSKVSPVPSGVVAQENVRPERATDPVLAITADDAREPVQVPDFSATLVSHTGQPVSDAFVSWTPIHVGLRDPISARVAIMRTGSSTGIATRSGENGRFEFVDAPPILEANPSIVWITHPSHAAAHVLLDPDPASRERGRTIVLSHQAPVSITVVDAVGGPVPGATVTQWGVSTSNVDDPELFDEHAWLIERRHVTDESGRAFLHRMPGAEELRAHVGEHASVPWIGLAYDGQELELGWTFVVGGAILRGPNLSDSTSLFTVCSALVGSREIELARADTELERWGPFTIPLVDAAEEYRFVMGGFGVLRDEHIIAPPLSGTNVVVDFRAEAGNQLWFFVAGTDEEPLADAEVTIDLEAAQAEFTRTSRVRPDGYVAFIDCPDGVYRASASCPGYVPAVEFGPIVLPLPPELDGTQAITLERAGVVRGRVIANGAPVREFELSLWPTHNNATSQHHRFRGRADGSFSLSEVPSGNVTLIATATGFGQSDPARVHVREGVAVEAVLALLNDVVVRGRVVDAATGAAIDGASVQRWVSDVHAPVRKLGEPVPVAPDGTFRVDGLARGATVLTATAPGFSVQTVHLTAIPDEETNVGSVTLHARQTLDVRLRLRPGENPTHWSVHADGIEGLPLRYLDADGGARYDAVSPGPRIFYFREKEGTRDAVHERTLTSGETWLVEVDLAGSARVDVRVVSDRGKPLPASALLAAKELSDGRTWRTDAIDAQGRATLLGLSPGVHQLEVLDGPATWRLLATKRIEVAEGDEKSVVIHVGDETRRIRVVDEDGEPLVGVEVQLSLPGSPLEWSVGARTDAVGECEIEGLGEEQVFAQLWHASLGSRLGIELQLLPVGEVVEVVFERGTRFMLQLTGLRGPVPGVTAYLLDESGLFSIKGPFSDASGLLVFEAIAPGSYELVIDQPAYFTVRRSIDVIDGAPPVEVELLRRCNLRVRATRGGLPLSRLAITLAREGDTRPFTDYLNVGWLRSEPEGLTTGVDGTLEVLGMPEGEYTWSVTMGDERVVAGTLSVEPDRENELRVDE